MIIFGKKLTRRPVNFFKESTVAVGVLYIIFALAVIASIRIWDKKDFTGKCNPLLQKEKNQ